MRNNAGGGEAAKKKDSLFLEKLEGRNGNEKEKKKSGFRKTNKHPIYLFGREFFVLGLNCWMKGIKRRGLEDETGLDFE